MNKKLNITIAIFLFVINLFFWLAPAVKAVNLQDAFSGQLNTVGTRSGFNTNQRNVEPIIGTIISVVLSFLGVIFLVLMIYGGYMWMTAAGNEEKAKKARQLIQAAILGLIVVVGAYAITIFVMGRLAAGLVSGGGALSGGGAYDVTSKSSQEGGAAGCCVNDLTVPPDNFNIVCTDMNDDSNCKTPPLVNATFHNVSCSEVPACNQDFSTGCCVNDRTEPPGIIDIVCSMMPNDGSCQAPPLRGTASFYAGDACSTALGCP